VVGECNSSPTKLLTLDLRAADVRNNIHPIKNPTSSHNLPQVKFIKERLAELLFLLKNRDEREDQSYETYRDLMSEYDLLFERYSKIMNLETGGK